MQEIIPLIVSSFGAGLSLILMVVFFRNINKSFFFLGIIFLSFFLILFEEILWISKIIYTNIHFAEYSEFLIFLIPPSLYFYSKSQLGKSIKWTAYLHYIPAVFAFLNFVPFYFSGDSLKSCYIIEELTDEESVKCKKLLTETLLFIVKDKIIDFVNIVQFLFYLWLSYPFLKKVYGTKAKKVQLNFLNWSNIIIGLSTIAILLILADVLLIDSLNDFFSIYYLTAIAAIVAYNLMVESVLLQDNFKSNNYRSISKEDSAQIIKTLRILLKQEKVYQNPKMSIEKISSELKIPRNKIVYAFSQINSDFKEELNQLRIKKAKELLTEASNLTIEAIGNEVGYSSKATFYKYFKRYVGATPSEFLGN